MEDLFFLLSGIFESSEISDDDGDEDSDDDESISDHSDNHN